MPLTDELRKQIDLAKRAEAEHLAKANQMFGAQKAFEFVLDELLKSEDPPDAPSA